jgi:hypothetical protein
MADVPGPSPVAPGGGHALWIYTVPSHACIDWHRPCGSGGLRHLTRSRREEKTMQARRTPVDGQKAIGITFTGTPVPAIGWPEADEAKEDCQNGRRVSGVPRTIGGPVP